MSPPLGIFLYFFFGLIMFSIAYIAQVIYENGIPIEGEELSLLVLLHFFLWPVGLVVNSLLLIKYSLDIVANKILNILKEINK